MRHWRNVAYVSIQRGSCMTFLTYLSFKFKKNWFAKGCVYSLVISYWLRVFLNKNSDLMAVIVGHDIYIYISSGKWQHQVSPTLGYDHIVRIYVGLYVHSCMYASKFVSE